MVARGAAAPCTEVISASCSSLLKIIAPEREKLWWWPPALRTVVWWLIIYDLKHHHHHQQQHLGAEESHNLFGGQQTEALLQLTAHWSLLQHHQLFRKTISKPNFQIIHAIVWAKLRPFQSKWACWAFQKGVAFLVMSKGWLSHGGACTTSSQRKSIAWAKFT